MQQHAGTSPTACTDENFPLSSRDFFFVASSRHANAAVGSLRYEEKKDTFYEEEEDKFFTAEV